MKHLTTILDIDKHHVFDLANRYEKQGLVSLNPVRSRPRTVELNRNHFLYPELVRLFLRLASPIPTRPRHRLNRRGRVGIENVATLFGTRGRTVSLTLIALLGEVNMTDLRKMSQLRDQSIQVIAQYWQSLGFIRSRRLGGERVLSLDPGHRAAPQMLALLLRMGEHLPGSSGLLAWQKRAVENRKKIVYEHCPASIADAIPVGTPNQRELLSILASHGALPVAVIATTMKWTQNRVRSTIYTLELNGLVQTARAVGLRNGSLWAALGHPSVESFLRKVAVGFMRKSVVPFQLPLIAPQFRRLRRRPRLLGPPLVRKLLIVLAGGLDVEDLELAKIVGSSARLVRRSISHLAECGVVEWRPVGGRAKARLNPRYVAYREFIWYLAAAGIHVRDGLRRPPDQT